MENTGIAIRVEEWLSSIGRCRGTKAKIRNNMSAVCSHAVLYSSITSCVAASVVIQSRD
jgi:hypothetical protein